MTTLKWLAMTFSVLLAGCSSIIYPEPIPEAAENITTPLNDSDKKILSVQWMRNDFSVEIKSLSAGEAAGLLIKTKGYVQGEQVTVVLGDENTNDDGGSYTVVRKITGHVDEHGEVRVWLKI